MTNFTYSTQVAKYEKLVHDISYAAQSEFPNGTLPVEKDILCCMLYLLRPGKAEPERSINDAADILSFNLIDHWHLCNIYTIPVRLLFYLVRCTKL